MSQNLKELGRRLSRLSNADRAHLILFLLESLEPADGSTLDERGTSAEAHLDAVERGEAAPR